MSLLPSSLPPRLRLLLAAALLLLPAAWNGLPLMYPDTPTYLRGAEAGLSRLLGPGRLPAWGVDGAPNRDGEPRAPAPTGLGGPVTTAPPAPAPTPAPARAAGLSAPEEGVVLAGRSVYYGALLEAAQLAGSLWWAVAAQALCLAWLLQLLLVERWALSGRSFLVLTGGLALATPAGLYTGLLMPDIFAGMAVLASGLLIFPGPTLRDGQRAALALLLLFALCAHASHLALVAVLLVLTMAKWLAEPLATGQPRGSATLQGRSAATPPTGARRARRPLPLAGGLLLVAACVAGALLAEAAFSRAVTQAVGMPPLRLPFLTARLVDRGPGAAYLRQACPQLPPGARWAACAFTDRYPLAWTDFLFDPDPARGVFAPADAATKRQLSQEQLALAWQVLRQDPAGVLGGMAADAGRQLLMFRIDIWGLGPRELALYAGRVPPALMTAMRHSRGARAPEWQERFSTLTVVSVLASLALLAQLAWRSRGRGERAGGARDPLAAWVLAGLLLNAALCAALAAPLDRFQARVVWLLPLLAAGLALRRVAKSAATEGPRPGPATAPAWPAPGPWHPRPRAGAATASDGGRT